VSGVGKYAIDLCSKSRTSLSEGAKTWSAGLSFEDEGGEWRFVGTSTLLPVYEEIEDGAEILWTEYGALPIRTIKKLVKKKAPALSI